MAVRILALLPPSRYAYFDALHSVTPHKVVEWILAELKSDEGMKLHGAMPQIEGHEDIENPYAEWLATNAT